MPRFIDRSAVGESISSNIGRKGGSRTGVSGSTVSTTEKSLNAARPSFGVSWSPLPAGTPFTVTGYKGVTFTSSATVTVTGDAGPVEYLVVAGGGLGAPNTLSSTPTNPGYAGGGGAGGLLTGTLIYVTPGNHTVTVGGSGSPSTFSTITTNGGGAGGQYTNQPGSPGGSGGGGSIAPPVPRPGAVRNTTSGGVGNTPPTTPPQGTPGGGGIGGISPVPLPLGGPVPGSYGSGGGLSYTSDINGVSTTYAVGGSTSPTPTSVANSGNGGPGGYGATGVANVGDSGIVIIRWPTYPLNA